LAEAEVQAVEYVCNGADGADGADGEQGPPGLAGTASSTYILRATITGQTGAGLAQTSGRIFCDLDDDVISGGYFASSFQVIVSGSHPGQDVVGGAYREWWSFRAVETVGADIGSFTLTMYIHCADTNPGAPLRASVADELVACDGTECNK
jgi:hypothetical protein